MRRTMLVAAAGLLPAAPARADFDPAFGATLRGADLIGLVQLPLALATSPDP